MALFKVTVWKSDPSMAIWRVTTHTIIGMDPRMMPLLKTHYIKASQLRVIVLCPNQPNKQQTAKAIGVKVSLLKVMIMHFNSQPTI